MASKLSFRLATRNAYESLWNHAPPSFLAPALTSSALPFSTTSSLATTVRKAKKHERRDTYALRQAKARKDANLSRQAILKEQRAKEVGDPIRGIPTPFVESFDTIVPQQQIAQDADAISLEALKTDTDKPPPSPAHASEEIHLNHGIQPRELEESIKFSRWLTEPLASTDLGRQDPDREVSERRQWEARHATAAEAIQRITSLANGSSLHRTKKNVERVVETLGRHKTDLILKPKASANTMQNAALAQTAEPAPRVGPDTGSSEVQIGVLTAKIRVLADRYEGESRKDKVNKRNLRLLLHRRQKLLKYMERKERGSERWQHMLQTLGLTPACWKGQLSVE
ncbi:hypothetical protein N7G274_005048 [Stereocaulon virgatum]|uniref:Ribosomal protein S15 n=1 Tax=Stereocaulon virgatum TaxID=373712 RepID=A0ABR4A9I4_9LECA